MLFLFVHCKLLLNKEVTAIVLCNIKSCIDDMKWKYNGNEMDIAKFISFRFKFSVSVLFHFSYFFPFLFLLTESKFFR